jgi:hypothetical protein
VVFLSDTHFPYQDDSLIESALNLDNDFRAAVRSCAPNAVIDETEGNHDSRMVSFVKQNAKALSSLRALEPRHLFRYIPLESTGTPERASSCDRSSWSSTAP